MPQPDLDLKALLVAVEVWERDFHDYMGDLDYMDELWPQALRALVAHEEIERHTSLACEDCWHGVCKQRVQQVADTDRLRSAVLLAAQERLLGKE